MWFFCGKSQIKYSGSDSTVKDAPDEMGTIHSIDGLAGYPAVPDWAKFAATVSRYKASKLGPWGSQ
jgi:hypothetical protein